IRVHVIYHYTDPNDSSATGSGADDSEETPPPGLSDSNPTWYCFTSHKPTSVVVHSQVTLKHQAGTEWPDISGKWTYIDMFFHVLKDQLGDGQPGVWVTERFPYLADV